MLHMARRASVWIALLTFTLAACSSTINLRTEDYARAELDRDYRIVMLDDREYTATNLAIKDGVASFTQKGEAVSVPVDEIKLIQQVNNNELLTGVVGVGIALAIVGGLVLVMKPD